MAPARSRSPSPPARAPAIRGESAGEGPPVVLCHGITATRRYVVHGSRALERAGHRVVAYDARGHGESDPAPAGQGYGYPELVGDLEAVIAATVGEGRLVLAGHSMGAHTAVAYALRHPERVAGLVVDRPGLRRRDPGRGRCAYWDGLAAALEEGGVDGFVDYIDRDQGIDPAWRDSVLRFTRERMLLPPPPRARSSRRCARCRARVRSSRWRSWRRSRSRRWSSPATTPPTPATPTRWRGLRRAAAAGAPGRRGGGGVPARLAGRQALPRDRRLLRRAGRRGEAELAAQ